MSTQSAGTRWWENYLVRYFLPSVAGMVIVRWLDLNTEGSITQYIPSFLITEWKDFGTPHLIIWLLFGSLYCYISSYPILVFHATRVLDFEGRIGTLKNCLFNPYLGSIFLAFIGYLAAWKNCLLLAVLAVAIFSTLQIVRLYKVYIDVKKFHFKNKHYKASLAYAYLDKLARRRGIKEEKSITEDDSSKTEKTSAKLTDISDSYRHLREHGNTAFIFFLELSLCPIFYVALKNQENLVDFSYLAILLLIWIFPSMLVHFLGQHLERRFSLFDGDIKKIARKPNQRIIFRLRTDRVKEQSNFARRNRKTRT